ncbi:MAG: GNAT family N-acetyltransferase [Acidimicrobiia bacterium]|nr:GNAT family N-acetyltransferase [Acidimicrobiia bacterium]
MSGAEGIESVETERLQLRPWEENDRDAHARLYADPDFSRYPWGRGLTPDEAAAAHGLAVGHWRVWPPKVHERAWTGRSGHSGSTG